MNPDLKDILSNLNPEIDQETLLLYLQGKLSAQQQHEVEKQLIDDELQSDALEGLEKFSDKKKLEALIHQLNYDLKKKSAQKNARKKQELKLDSWLIVTVVIILFLIILSFFIIHRYLQQ